MNTKSGPTFPRLIQDFFCQYLANQRSVSPHTVASYRDTFRLLLRFMNERTGKPPSALALTDLDAPSILAFLEHLETNRGNSARTRNVRLAAIRGFLNYAAYQEPTAIGTIQRVQAIPNKRYDRPLLGFLSREEMQAILDAPDRSTWSGERDHAMWLTFYNTGARVSEIAGLRMTDLKLEGQSYVRIYGKGRKQRTIPLWKETERVLADWKDRTNSAPDAPVFPNRRGQRLTRAGIEDRLRRSVQTATGCCRTLRGRRVSPHTLRHTTAMHLLQSGVEMTVIALWLGHESLETTHQYIEADLQMKRQALETVPGPIVGSDKRWEPSDDLLSFLDTI